jgi:hypothetical protein
MTSCRDPVRRTASTGLDQVVSKTEGGLSGMKAALECGKWSGTERRRNRFMAFRLRTPLFV